MDLNQRKLTKSEWDSIEVPVSEQEKMILNMIVNGYNDVNIRINLYNSILTFLKIEYSDKMEDHIYNKYFKEDVEKLEIKLKNLYPDYNITKIDANAKINSSDKIRLERNDETNIKKDDIYEFILLYHAEKIVHYKKKENIVKFAFNYYTLYMLMKNNIVNINRHLKKICNTLLDKFQNEINILTIIENASSFIEKNDKLLKYSDLTLYSHQKEIFTVCKNPNPKLILYMAPTGTGKTLTPLALSEGSKIIFVCAARHVGLAFARSAISMNKKIAFAFGCASADDIRLHFFAAKEYTKDRRSGGIRKVDNSIGDDVEIMICDIKSYLPAMFYMMAFNPREKIILYWDEPTITMDYDNHEFHEIIKENWTKNLIPNVVLSSATLPKLHELTSTLPDFRNRFVRSEVYNIVSHDCKKSIPIINKDGYVVLPHYLCEEYEDMKKVAKHCKEYLTLSRYFDLEGVVEFISYVLKNNYVNSKAYIERYFENIDDITMTTIKEYYVKLLDNIIEGTWGAIYTHFRIIRRPRILSNETIDPKGNKIFKTRSVGPGVLSSTSTSRLAGNPITRLTSVPETIPPPMTGTSGVYVTTKDAYTLTDGPTIFISDEVEKISKFCLQQANIPSIVMDEIMKKIEYNNAINEKLQNIENDLECAKDRSEKSVKNDVSGGRTKSTKDIRKFNRDAGEEDGAAAKSEISKLANEMNILRSMIKSATLNDTFVPNKPLHLSKWAEGLEVSRSFSSDIDENTVSEIMALHGIDNSWKVLLMMGIGVFTNHKNITYTEIMKKLADTQKLYMIIATSDYIYGTNYQFCHGFLSKDLNLTQEKIIQAMGRIGRNNIQQTYTVRFRDDNQILKLFTSDTEKPEVLNMNKLFSSI
jgi:hypothetical protein